MKWLVHLWLCFVTITVVPGAEGYRLTCVSQRPWAPQRNAMRRLQCLTAVALPLTATQVEDLEREYIGFEAEEKKPPKCPLMTQYLSNRIVKAIVEHDMDMLMERSIDASGRPTHLQQKWKIRPHRKRLSPVLFRVGEKLKGRVAVTFPTYALVDVGSTSYGVLHARDMSEGWIDRVDHSISSGDDIVVIVKSIDEDGRFIRLSLLDLPKLESATGTPLERRPIHSFKVEETVSGVIRRRSPLGYYIDIGATVDGFLHTNDRKLPRKYTGVDRQPLRIGTHVPTLYIKSVDLIKNRIQLSENSISEEMEKRCMTGQETPEQQSLYSSGAQRSMLQKMQATDLETMKMIGGYDNLLEEVGGNRNSSTDYVMYLQNRKLRSELMRKRDSLHDDADNMTQEEFRKATKQYNELTMQIAELDDDAVEPPPFERTVYKYGEPGVWESRVYTPFDETNPRQYFEKMTDEVTSALRDVQGCSFNFKGVMDDDLNNAEKRGEFVDMLWAKFHQPPSNLSKIEDREPREPLLEDVEDLLPSSLLSDDGSSHLSRAPDPDEVIATLKSYNDPDADELADMIRGATGFNPFDHSPKLVDDDESALAGACAMVDDDITQWQSRLDKMYEDAGIDPVTAVTNTLAGKDVTFRKQSGEHGNLITDTVDDHNHLMGSIENVDDFVTGKDESQSEGNFVSPEVEGDSYDGPKYLGNSDAEDDYDWEHSHAESDGEFSESVDNEEDGTDEDYKKIAEEIFGPEKRLKSILSPTTNEEGDNAIKGEKNKVYLEQMDDNSCMDFEPGTPATVPKGTLEPDEELYRPSTLSDDVQDIIKEVRALTQDLDAPNQTVDTVPPSRSFVNRDTQSIKYDMYMKQHRYADPITRLYMMTKFPKRPLPKEAENTTDYEDSSYENGKESDYTTGCDTLNESQYEQVISDRYDFVNDSDDEFTLGSESGQEPVEESALKEARSLAKTIKNSDKRRRTLARMARKHLSAEEIEKHKIDNKDPEYMEELARVLRQGRERPKLTPYTYFPEGIDKAGLEEDKRTMNRRVRDANLKIAKLKRNKRFLHMLDRLGVNADDITFENIHLLLPQELVSERPLPYRRLVGIGETNIPDNKG